MTIKDIPMALTAWVLGSSSVALALTKSPVIGVGLSVLCVSVLLLSRISGVYSLSCSKCLGSNRKVKRHYNKPMVEVGAHTTHGSGTQVTLGWSVTYISVTKCGACGGEETASHEGFISRNLAPTLSEAKVYAAENRELLLKSLNKQTTVRGI